MNSLTTKATKPPFVNFMVSFSSQVMPGPGLGSASPAASVSFHDTETFDLALANTCLMAATT